MYKPTTAVYSIHCSKNGKRYIGSSNRIRKRWANHRNRLRANKHRNRLLQEDWNKYSELDFIFSIIEYCNPEELLEREEHWCEFYKSNFKDLGYNIDPVIPKEDRSGRNERLETIPKRDILGVPVILINKETKEIKEYSSCVEVSEELQISYKKVGDLVRYWKYMKGDRKSYNNWIIVKKEDYDSTFDYISYRKQRSKKEQVKKESKPYEERNLTRRKIYLLKENESEERIYDSIIKAIKELDLKKVKVHKCLKNEFKKYKTGGWFIKYLD